MIARFNIYTVKDGDLTITSSNDHNNEVFFIKLQCGKFTLEKSFQNTFKGLQKKEEFLKDYGSKEKLELYFKRKVKKI